MRLYLAFSNPPIFGALPNNRFESDEHKTSAAHPER